MRKHMANKGNILTNDQVLLVDDYLVSPNGQFRLVMQGDGNLCVYGPAGCVFSAASNAPGGRFFAVMQSDGNFCVYKGAPNQNLGWLWGTQVTIPGGGRCFATVEDDGSFNVYRGTGHADKQGLLWSTQTASATLIQKYAPMVYLHPFDKSRPDSVENYFKTVVLKGPDGRAPQQKPGAPPPMPVTADVLRAYNDPNCYLEFSNGQYPTASNNFDTGSKITSTGQPNTGESAAPVYVKSFRTPTHIDIKYIFFYPFQSYQTFRIGIRTGLGGFDTKKRNFEWSRFGRHGADWEHLTVRLDPSGQRMLGAFYSQHGNSVWVEKPTLADNTHPVARAALNSHALYTKEDTYETKSVLSEFNALLLGLANVVPPITPQRIPLLMMVAWAKTVDTTTTEHGLVTYDATPRSFTQVQWAPYRNPSQLVILDKNPTAEQWLDFLGCWGPPKLDNRQVERPPALPDDVQDALFEFANTPYVQGKLTEKLKFGDGPKSPKQQNWWLDKEP